MIFDTHKLAKALELAFTREQADSLTVALSSSTLESVATKADIAEVKVEIADLKASLIQWIVGALAFNFVAVTGLVIAIIKVFGR